MYFVDKDLLIERLDYIERLTGTFEEREDLALERSCHMLIEAVVDVGNMIIDAFILRDPGSYQDVMDIMENEGVIPSEDNRRFQKTFRWRSELTRNYTRLDHEEMKADFKEHLSAYRNYRKNVFDFFENEGQAITAFRGDQHEV
ncbi:DUF86 domain-containing protein [Salinicoccus sp. ID82-1]|uniref:DUF86 domain-containing protein n=1 Tax=Salinicoccus sp. ID82-1 TaxID=2820269 RepID=UPI001F409082|nr:DUF86 domain-containing protein [Salinicoccus sp. ID82-1]MCG1010103.1 DUF86 domain-containing protein [Salinicoccus sp. ID82-1]